MNPLTLPRSSPTCYFLSLSLFLSGPHFYFNNVFPTYVLAAKYKQVDKTTALLYSLCILDRHRKTMEWIVAEIPSI
jgi:hypothetical protein